MAIAGLFWIELGLGVVLLLLSAKAHGRQIRLERELEGHMEVDFMGENDPWVEALWKKDRRQYWVTFPAVLGLLAAYVTLAGAFGLPPHFGKDPFGLPFLGAVLLAALLWTPVVAFIGNGLTSARRLTRAMGTKDSLGLRRERVDAERGEWLRDATRGSYFYWGLVAICIAAAAIVAII